MKSENVFSGLFTANGQKSRVSVIVPWINAVEEIGCLSKLHHVECIKEVMDFDLKAKKTYEDYVIKNKIQPDLTVRYRLTPTLSEGT